MKKFLIILITLFVLTACDSSKQEVTIKEKPTPSKYEFVLKVQSGNSWSSMSSFVECDSFIFVSTKEVDIWVDGTKNKILTDWRISVSSRNLDLKSL